MGSLILNVLPLRGRGRRRGPDRRRGHRGDPRQVEPPLFSAWVFTTGAACLVLVYSAVVLALAEASGAFDGGGNSEAGAIVDLVLGAIFLGLGVIAIFSHEDPEKDAAQRQRIERAATAGLGGILLVGLVAQVINVDALAVFTGALKEIAESDVPTGRAAVAFALGLAVMPVPNYGPAIVYAISPERSGRALARMSDRLLERSRALEIVVGLGFGAVFLVKGSRRSEAGRFSPSVP